LPKSTIPKLFVNVKPGFFSPILEDHCRSWENQQEVVLKGHHFVQEDSPEGLGIAIVDFLNELGS
jgi:haloalkane dehalogenase